MIKKTARLLRKNQTSAESVLWFFLRNRKLGGQKFVRQYPFTIRDMGRSRFVVVDFYCHVQKLAIEIDGSIHDSRQEIDKYRQKILEKMGIRLIRFKNEDVFDNVNHVLDDIASHFSSSSSPLFQERGRG
jgi:very-short-patch-repair endonuclease